MSEKGKKTEGDAIRKFGKYMTGEKGMLSDKDITRMTPKKRKKKKKVRSIADLRAIAKERGTLTDKDIERVTSRKKP